MGAIAFPAEQNDPGDGRYVAALHPRDESKRLQVFGIDLATVGECPPYSGQIEVARDEVTQWRLIKAHPLGLALQLADQLRICLAVR